MIILRGESNIIRTLTPADVSDTDSAGANANWCFVRRNVLQLRVAHENVSFLHQIEKQKRIECFVADTYLTRTRKLSIDLIRSSIIQSVNVKLSSTLRTNVYNQFEEIGKETISIFTVMR